MTGYIITGKSFYSIISEQPSLNIDLILIWVQSNNVITNCVQNTCIYSLLAIEFNRVTEKKFLLFYNRKNRIKYVLHNSKGVYTGD